MPIILLANDIRVLKLGQGHRKYGGNRRDILEVILRALGSTWKMKDSSLEDKEGVY